MSDYKFKDNEGTLYAVQIDPANGGSYKVLPGLVAVKFVLWIHRKDGTREKEKFLLEMSHECDDNVLPVTKEVNRIFGPVVLNEARRRNWTAL